MLFCLGISLALLLATIASPAKGASPESSEREKEPRIINGTVANPADWPFLASVSETPPYPYTRNKHPYCGASVVSNRFLLTAGHCFIEWQREAFYGTAGRPDLTLNTGKTVKGDTVFLHPRFANKESIGGLPYDAALLRLQEPIGAPAAKLADFTPAAGSAVKVAGFGISDFGSGTLSTQLLGATNKRIPNDTCRALSPPILTFFFRSQFCTKTTNTSGACYGDSGGPLTQNGELVGLVSSGDAYCRKNNRADIYTKVAAIRGWVRETINRNSSRGSINWVKGDRLGKRRFQLLTLFNSESVRARVRFSRRVCIGQKCYPRNRRFLLPRIPVMENPGSYVFLRWYPRPFRIKNHDCLNAKITARFRNGDLVNKWKKICA